VFDKESRLLETNNIHNGMQFNMNVPFNLDANLGADANVHDSPSLVAEDSAEHEFSSITGWGDDLNQVCKLS
jgi:hypothetical protein